MEDAFGVNHVILRTNNANMVAAERTVMMSYKRKLLHMQLCMIELHGKFCELNQGALYIPATARYLRPRQTRICVERESDTSIGNTFFGTQKNVTSDKVEVKSKKTRKVFHAGGLYILYIGAPCFHVESVAFSTYGRRRDVTSSPALPLRRWSYVEIDVVLNRESSTPWC